MKRIPVRTAKSVASDAAEEDENADLFSMHPRKSKKRQRKPKALYESIIPEDAKYVSANIKLRLRLEK